MRNELWAYLCWFVDMGAHVSVIHLPCPPFWTGLSRPPSRQSTLRAGVRHMRAPTQRAQSRRQCQRPPLKQTPRSGTTYVAVRLPSTHRKSILILKGKETTEDVSRVNIVSTFFQQILMNTYGPGSVLGAGSEKVWFLPSWSLAYDYK